MKPPSSVQSKGRSMIGSSMESYLEGRTVVFLPVLRGLLRSLSVSLLLFFLLLQKFLLILLRRALRRMRLGKSHAGNGKNHCKKDKGDNRSNSLHEQYLSKQR